MIETVCLVLPIVCLAAATQASTGFGFSIVAMPLLLLALPAEKAVLINLALATVIAIVGVPGRASLVAERATLTRLFAGAAIGIALGIVFAPAIDEVALDAVVAVAAIVSAAAVSLGMRFDVSDARDRLAGFMSGLLTMIVGMPGVALLIYFSAATQRPDRQRNIARAVFAGLYPPALLVHLLAHPPSFSDGILIATSVPAIALGIVPGRWVAARMNPYALRRVMVLLLFAMGVSLAVKYAGSSMP